MALAKKPNKLSRKKIGPSTQQYLNIAEIKENTVILRDGTLRSVLLVSSINFSLKSEEEQEAIVGSYVGFLNNIDFPLQIVIQSRELSIENYINRLKVREKEQTNELLKMQIAEYTQYVQELVDIGKIMGKRFYIVIPYDPLSDRHKNFFTSVKEALTPVRLVKMKERMFKQRREQLTRRVDNVLAGLSSIGLSAVELDTQSLIELYYNTYNPVVSLNEKMTDINDLRIRK